MNRARTIILIVFFILLVSTASAINTYTTMDYTIELPPGWRFDDANDDGTVLTFTSEGGGGYAWVIISVYSSAGMSPAQILKYEREYLIEKKGYPSYEEDVNINGLRGVRWRYIDYYEGVAYQNHRVILPAGTKYYTITASTRESNMPSYFLDFEQIFNSFKTKGVPVPAATETKTSYVSLTGTQGEEISWANIYSVDASDRIGSYAWADASGDAASWVTPTRIDYGLVNPGEEIKRDYTIRVPSYQSPGYYELIWKTSCKKSDGTICTVESGGVMVLQITVEEKPTDDSAKIGLAVFLFIGLYIVVRAVKGAKRREEKPAPVFIPTPTPVQAPYPAAPKKPHEPAARPQANELKELKEKLSKTNQLLDKLDERLVNGELTEAKYKELAGKYKAEADSLKNQIAEKELLNEVGLKDE